MLWSSRQCKNLWSDYFAGDQFESGIFLNWSENFRELNYDYTEQFIELSWTDQESFLNKFYIPK